MRQIIFDTETTGLSRKSDGGDVATGHRIIEIACVELQDRRPTGRHFQSYFNPHRAVDEKAFEVHGISDDFLLKQPDFGDVFEELMQYLHGADELIAHNISFDQAFINQELRLLGESKPLEKRFKLLDTLALARSIHPGQRNNLDTLCRRYGIDNSKRELHGALLDAQLLAEVYLKLTSGQSELFVAAQKKESQLKIDNQKQIDIFCWPAINIDDSELAAHNEIMNDLNAK